tara:strand:- start:198 stop:1037 length:840 start_codon:yes stop_codon:yes gene_type:complete
MLGIAPQLEKDGSYIPSKIALKLATVKKTDYKSEPYQKYKGNKSKILVLFTEQQKMKMQNGTLFSTGNHPVEALVPMLHLQNAGFEFEIYTPTGKPVVFEMWAFPSKDNEVLSIYNELKLKFEKPNSLHHFATNTGNVAANFAAVFIPGGHGAMLGIPEDENVGRTLNWAHENNLFTISICHGPGALLATTLINKSFIYKGYKMAVFPDSVDKMTPKMGYLPGQMPHGLSEKLKSLGANVVNTKADNTVCIDRKLITGASPLASNQLGKLATNTLLKAN